MFYDQDVNEESEREAVLPAQAGEVSRRDRGVHTDDEVHRRPLTRFYSFLRESARLDLEWSRRAAYYCGAFGREPMVQIYAFLLIGVASLQARIRG